MKNTVVLLFVALCFFAGCDSKQQENSTSKSVNSSEASALAPKTESQKFTLKDWNDKVNSSFDRVDSKKITDKKNPVYEINDAPLALDESGKATFLACFDKSINCVEKRIQGSYDAFKKLYHFKHGAFELYEYIFGAFSSQMKPNFAAYLALSQCSKKPTLFLRLSHRGGKWLFLSDFGVLADGESVLQRSFEYTDVHRETIDGGVEEMIHFSLTEAEINNIAKIVSSNSVHTRVVGKNGYYSLEKETVDRFKKSFPSLLEAYQALKKSLDEIGVIDDVQCKQ